MVTKLPEIVTNFFVLQESEGKWVSLDSEIILKNGEPIGTQTATGHYVLLDARFELPYGELTSSLLLPSLYEHFDLNIAEK